MQTFKNQILDIWEVTGKNGFLPKIEPEAQLPDRFQVLENIMQNLPSLLEKNELGNTIDISLPDYLDEIKQINDDPQLIISLFRDFCFLASAYTLEECHLNFLETGQYQQSNKILCRKIALPLVYLAQLQNSKPWLDYSRSYNNYNYIRVDKSKGVTFDNIKAIRTFSKMEDEPGFILTHTAIDGYSPQMCESIEKIFESITNNDRNQLNQNLQQMVEISHQIWKELKTMYGRTEVKAFSIFRTFLNGTKGSPMFPNGLIYEGYNNDQPLQIYGSSGALDLFIPTVDRLFSIQERFPDNALTQLLQKYKEQIPDRHNEYLKKVERNVLELDLVGYCSRDPKSFLLFLKNLQMIINFRYSHFNLVKEYILKRHKKAVGTGGSDVATFISNQLETVLVYALSLINDVQFKQDDQGQILEEINQLKISFQDSISKHLVTSDTLKKLEKNYYHSIIQNNLKNDQMTCTILQQNDTLSPYKSEFNQSKGIIYLSLNAQQINKIQNVVNVEKNLETAKKNICEKIVYLFGAFSKECYVQNDKLKTLDLLLSNFQNKVLMLGQNFREYKTYYQGKQELIIQELAKNDDQTKQILDIIDEYQNQLSVLVVQQIDQFGNEINIQSIVQKCKQWNIFVILDVEYSLGNVKLKLHDDLVDAAIISTFNFMGGHSNIGAVFLHHKHLETINTQKENYDFSNSFEQINSLNLLLDFLIEAGPLNTYSKINDLSQYARCLFSAIDGIVFVNHSINGLLTLKIIKNDSNLTSTIYQKLQEKKIICDLIDGNIRFTLWPLSTSFSDVFQLYETFNTLI